MLMKIPSAPSASIATRVWNSARSKRTLPRFLAVGIGLSLVALPGRAAVVTWDGDVGATWASALNWSTDAAPVADDLLNAQTIGIAAALTLDGGRCGSRPRALWD